MDALKKVLQTLWVGGLWAVGFVVAPALFRTDAAHAGLLAGVIFTWMAWVGMVCGAFLLVHVALRQGFRAVQASAFWLILGMLVCTVVNHFAVFPIIADLKAGAANAAQGVLGGGFSTWHTISSLIYLLQCMLGLSLVIKE